MEVKEIIKKWEGQKVAAMILGEYQEQICQSVQNKLKENQFKGLPGRDK